MNILRFSFGPSVERVFKTGLTFSVAFGGEKDTKTATHVNGEATSRNGNTNPCLDPSGEKNSLILASLY